MILPPNKSQHMICFMIFPEDAICMNKSSSFLPLHMNYQLSQLLTGVRMKLPLICCQFGWKQIRSTPLGRKFLSSIFTFLKYPADNTLGLKNIHLNSFDTFSHFRNLSWETFCILWTSPWHFWGLLGTCSWHLIKGNDEKLYKPSQKCFTVFRKLFQQKS